MPTTRSQAKHQKSESLDRKIESEEPAKKKRKTQTKSKETKTVKEESQNNALEYGHIYFFYRPKVEVEKAEDWSDVALFYLLLKPIGKNGSCRLISIAKKKLPNINSHQREWAYVTKVAKTPKEIVDSALAEVTNETETKGERTTVAARPVGEGLYAIVKHDKSSRLAYVLESPEEISQVQKAFGIEKESDFIVSVKNPTVNESEQLGLSGDEKANFDEELQDKFRGNKWAPLDPPDFLDYEGAELLLIGAHHHITSDLKEIGEEIEEKAEAEIKKNHYDPEVLYKELRMKVQEHPIEAVEGEWV